MTVHNYRSRQVHETLNGVNPSSGFRDMRSAKSGSNLWQIWQVFGPWASPYGANGQMSMTVHNYRPRQFHRTSNRENPSSGYRDMGSASLAAARPTARPPVRPPGAWRQYPSSPEGWGVKRCDGRTDSWTEPFIELLGRRQTDRWTNEQKGMFLDLLGHCYAHQWHLSILGLWHHIRIFIKQKWTLLFGLMQAIHQFATGTYTLHISTCHGERPISPVVLP